MMINRKKFMEWTSIILKGISVLPIKGKSEGLIVFRENAEPILTGSTEEEVFIAAAEIGKGRIVAIAENFNNSICSPDIKRTESAISLLNNNIKKWLTRGTFQKGNIIINANEKVNKPKLMSSKIVIYQGGENKIPLKDLTDFVRTGGALLHCFTPWKWLAQNKGRNLSDAPYMALLTDAGILYIDGYNTEPQSGFFVKENKAKDAHMLRFLLEARKNVSLATNREQTLMIMRNLIESGFLPLRTIVKNLLNNCTAEVESSTIPSHENPVKDEIAKQLLDVWLFYFNLLEPFNIKAPGVDLFPGDFTNKPSLKSRTLKFYSDREEYHSTGCYLPAGQTLKVEVISGNTDNNWDLLIGCHKDVLTNGGDDWRRWPNIHRQITLSKKRYEISSPFGGLVYLKSPNVPSLHIEVKLENVVDSPQFRTAKGDEGKQIWEKSRRFPGLWADIAGELVTITLRAANVRHLEFEALTSVMKTWDKVVRLHNDLRGTNVSEIRREWFVTDEQPVIGYMHSGYPIVTELDVGDPTSTNFFLNNTYLLEVGQWEAFHEIGHNMQTDRRTGRDYAWTFDGTMQVTCEIFALHAMHKLSNRRPWIHSWISDSLKKTEQFLKDGANFQKWKESADIALFIYAQLAREFGWESYKKVFRRYDTMDASIEQENDTVKIDMWFEIFSEVVEYNLAPLASFWNIPLSSEKVADLQKTYPVGFLPDDEVTRFVPDRVNAILHQFPGTKRGKYIPKQLPTR